MQNLDMQQALTIILPFIAFLVSYGLQQAKWTDRTNTLIASIVLLLAAGVTAFFEHKLTGSLLGDIGYVLSVAATLQSTAFTPLQKYLKENFPVRSASDPTERQVRASAQDWTRQFREDS